MTSLNFALACATVHASTPTVQPPCGSSQYSHDSHFDLAKASATETRAGADWRLTLAASTALLALAIVVSLAARGVMLLF